MPINTVFNIEMEEERNPTWEHFLEIMVSHSRNGSDTEFDHNGFHSGLEVFLTLPFCQSVSLFLINKETFEFHHQVSCPDLIDALAQKQFSALDDQGMIAAALNSNEGYLTCSLPNIKGEKHFLVLPLTVPSEIIGLLLISSDRTIEYWEHGLLQLCLLQGRQLAFSISHKAISRQLRNNKDLLRQKIAERTLGLEQSKRELKTVLDSIKTGIIIIDQETHRVMDANMTAIEMMGTSKEAILGSNCHSFCQMENEKCPFGNANLNGCLEHSEASLTKANGTSIPILKSAVPVVLGGRTCLIESFVDISERKHLENQIVQSQKMEAIGRLAGGVAHDFNNLLTAIMGYCDLTLTALGKDTQPHYYVEEINKAADRAASLTRQLLALSHKQVLQPTVLDLNSVLSDIKKMLLRVIGEDIELTTQLDENLGYIKADKGQVEQVIMNLTINARDAMPRGGKLILETTNCETDLLYHHQHPVVTPGSYILLSVSDTGEGMDKETQSHIFEPFFTTKDVGHGTGLGLSTVYGIVKQSGGYIWVYSELGKGTTFKVYLPRVADPLGKPENDLEPLFSPQGSETILLIEDETMLRSSIKEGLEINGYHVMAAGDGPEALSISQRYPDPIHLVLTDVVMPGMSGLEVAESITCLHPEAGVLYMSGYTDDMVIRNGLLHEKTAFLQKPFSAKTLAHKVREIMDLRFLSHLSVQQV